MKAAVSVPDKLFKSGDALAKRLGVSRSRLYADALAEMIAKHQKKGLTEKFNAVHDAEAGGAEGSGIDEVVNELQLRSLPSDQW